METHFHQAEKPRIAQHLFSLFWQQYVRMLNYYLKILIYDLKSILIFKIFNNCLKNFLIVSQVWLLKFFDLSQNFKNFFYAVISAKLCCHVICVAWYTKIIFYYVEFLDFHNCHIYFTEMFMIG